MMSQTWKNLFEFNSYSVSSFDFWQVVEFQKVLFVKILEEISNWKEELDYCEALQQVTSILLSINTAHFIQKERSDEMISV